MTIFGKMAAHTFIKFDGIVWKGISKKTGVVGEIPT